MSVVFRFDFPDEVVEERTRVFDKINDLLAAQRVDAVEEALSLHRRWVEQYPDDYVALDTGGHMVMYYEALLATQDCPEASPLALK